MTTDRAEAIVLGAGITGAALAHHLAKRHVGPVVVVDPRTPAGGATGRAAGIVTEQLWNEWDVGVVRESKAEYAALALRHDPASYRVNGFARWSTEESISEALLASVDRQRGWGVPVERIDPADLAPRLPGIQLDGVRAAVWGPNDGVVAPSRMTELYAEEARNAGVELQVGVPVDRIAPSEGLWSVEVGDGTIRARTLVVAAGAWSKQILREIGAPLPLAPYRTQAALLRPSPGVSATFPSVHDLDLDVYARPEDAGRVLAGDGTDRVEVDPETFRTGGDEAFVAHLAESFEARFPGWKDAELVRAWAGVCTSTPDRRPVVGPLPARPGLFVVTGFNGFGVMRAGGVAGRLARAITEPDSPQALQALGPVLPSRFGPDPPPFLPRPGFTVDGGNDPRF